jgi:hypothetical protein
MFIEVFLSVVASTGVVSIIGLLLKDWFVLKVTKAVEYSNQLKLEEYKNKLAGENLKIIETYKQEFTREMTHRELMQKSMYDCVSFYNKERISNALFLWKSVVNLRKIVPLPVQYLDSLEEDKYKTYFDEHVKNNPGFQIDISVFNSEYNNLSNDEVRLYVGGYIWNLYSIYRVVVHSVVSNYYDGCVTSHFSPWYRDDWFVKQLKDFYSIDDYAYFSSLKKGRLYWFEKSIEDKLIAAITDIFYGKETRDVAAKEITDIEQRLLQFRAGEN